MQKIMFNDKYGLMNATLNGTKTVTRRICNGNKISLSFSKYKEGEIIAIAQSYKDILLNSYDSEAGWNNKMFVKADLMPHHIQIMAIRVERLQDISDEDCIAEGIKKTIGKEDNKYVYYFGDSFSINNCFNSPRDAYSALINKISGKGTWESNPYVFVYDYKLIN